MRRHLVWLGLALMTLFFYVWGTYNTLAQRREAVEKHKGDIAVLLRRRLDLISQAVKVLLEYLDQERGVFESIASRVSGLRDRLDREGLPLKSSTRLNNSQGRS